MNFRDLVLEAIQDIIEEGARGYNRKRVPKLPNKPNSIMKKIETANPWGTGGEISKIIDSKWLKIKEIAGNSDSPKDFMNQLIMIPEIVTLTKKKHLSTSHFVDELIKYM